MTLQLRRGTTATRTAITLEVGEPGWDTDLNALFVGDGSTAGGVRVGESTATFTIVTGRTAPAGTVTNQIGAVLTPVPAGAPAAAVQATPVVNGAQANTDDSLNIDGGNIDQALVTAINDPFTRVYIGRVNTFDPTQNAEFRLVEDAPSVDVLTGDNAIPLQATSASTGSLAFQDNDNIFYRTQSLPLDTGVYRWSGTAWVAV